MKTGPLVRVSVAVAPESEEHAAALLERVCGRPVAVWNDEDTGAVLVSVYLDGKTCPPGLPEKISRALKQMESSGMETGPGKITVERIRPQDWAESWKRHFKPFQIGGRLLVRPGWSRRRARPGQKTVVLDPGLSFGTGQHPTTRYCLAQLTAARTAGRPQSFLDVGTGSGILAIAAAKLGFNPVAAMDFDPEAVRISRQNARLNGVEHRIAIARRDVARLPRRSRVFHDVICANLTADLLVEHAAVLAGLLAPQGRLILAGILDRQFDAVAARYAGLGMTLRHSKTEGEWKSGRFEWSAAVPVSRSNRP